MAQEIDLGKVAGVGVPAGGKAGQVLMKKTDSDYETEWVDIQIDMPPDASGVSF